MPRIGACLSLTVLIILDAAQRFVHLLHRIVQVRQLFLCFLLSVAKQTLDIQRLVRIAVLHGIPQGDVQLQTHQNHIHLDKLFQSIVPVTGFRVDIGGKQRTDSLIVAQRFGIDMTQLGKIADGQITLHAIVSPFICWHVARIST